MKKIILSTIASLTLITGTLIVLNMNTPQETTPTSSPEAVQSVIEPETVIDTPEQVEAVIETPVAPIAQSAPKEPAVVEEVIVREPTFEELVVKYNISGDPRVGKLKDLFDNRIKTAPAEDRFLLFMSRLGFDMTESHSIYDRDAAYKNWYETLKNNQGF